MFFYRKVPVLRQAEAAECGLACVGMIAGYWGKDYDLGALRRAHGISAQGAALSDIIDISKSLEMNARPLKAGLGSLRKLKLPAILHWEFNHFVVLTAIKRTCVIIHDPASGPRDITLAELSESYTGVAIELGPAPEFKKEKKKSRLKLLDFFRQTSGLIGPIIQVLALSLLIQGISLLLPFFTQIAIDSVVPTGDVKLLQVLAMGFGLIYLIDPLIDWLRTRLLIYVSVQFSTQLTANLVRFLFSLPLAYFEKRSIGDIMTRLEASDRLRDLLTQGFIAVVIDALLGFITLGMMFYYSSNMAWIVLGTAAMLAILRGAYQPSINMLVNEALQRQGSEQSEMIENLHGVMSIKFAQKEIERETVWFRLFSKLVDSSARLQAKQANYEVLSEIVEAVSTVTLIYLGITLVLDQANVFTVGAFFAFAAYRELFFERVNSFLDVMVEFSMAKVHLDRLSEILYAEPEATTPKNFSRNSFQELTFQEVSFSYDQRRKPVIDNASLKIGAGDTVMIFGPSGTGKTTLLKLLCGVYGSSDGIVTYNGIAIGADKLRFLRSHVAAVLQSDHLFKGSIADNISFFDPTPDFRRIEESAASACIHNEISSMPMTYETLVGEMSSSLSQGQQQRILLARALYQQKPILVLDEGTAHLDEENEAKVLSNISSLNLTVVMTAHKQTLSKAATQIWDVAPSGAVTKRLG